MLRRPFALILAVWIQYKYYFPFLHTYNYCMHYAILAESAFTASHLGGKKAMASRSDVLGRTDNMSNLDTLQKIRSAGIVVVLRDNDPDVAFKTAMACTEGGLTCLEITMTTPCALDLIEPLGSEEGVIFGWEPVSLHRQPSLRT